MPNPADNPFHRLPGFEGVDPVGTELAISGGSGRRSRAFHIGETFPMVIEVKVVGVEHTETKGGIVRKHKVALVDAYELGDNRAPDLLEALHAEHEEWLNEMRGTPALPFDGEQGTDAQTAAAGAGPEARADARADREQGDGWDDFDPSDEVALDVLAVAAENAVANETHETVEAFLAEVEQYAHDVALVEVDLGEVPPPADPPEGEASNVVDLPTGAAKKKAAGTTKKAAKKSPAPKK